MSRTIRLFLGFLLTLALLTGTAASSYGAQPGAAPRLSAPNLPANGPFSATSPKGASLAEGRANLKADLAAIKQQLANTGIKLPAIDGKNLPAAVRAAVDLRKSLSATQTKQMRLLMAKYSAGLQKITDAALAAGRPNAVASGSAPDNVRAQGAKLAKLTARMERQFTSLLSAKQHAKFTASRPAADTSLAASQPQAAQISPNALGANCYYGAYYELLSNYYKYYGYLYAYYNYATYGGTYAYYGYLYAYYAYVYGRYAAQYLSQTYFEYLTVGYDWLGIGDDGVYWAYYDYVYAYYSYVYESYSYTYEGGHTYAYYAYLYEYYGYYYGYYGYYYGYYYCQ